MVGVTTAYFSEFETERIAFEQKMPLRFLTPEFGINRVSLQDAGNRTFYSPGTFGTGSSFSSAFQLGTPNRVERMPSGEVGFLPASPPLEIACPVSLRIRMPTKYTSSKLRFVFNDLAIPPLPTPQSGD